jgi:predicted CopG family antitoxin
MKSEIDPDICIALMKKFSEVCEKFHGLKKRLDQIPKIIELYEYIFEVFEDKEIKEIVKSIEEMEGELPFCEETLTRMEKRFKEFLKSVVG